MTRRAIVLFSLCSALAATASPASGRSQRPPAVKSATPASPGTFVWHDLITDHPAASRAFYNALFGWTFESAEGVDPGYTIITYRKRWIGGIVQRRGAADNTAIAQWLSYVVVPDVDRASRAFEQAGGRVLRGPLNARKDLRVAAVEDAQGAPLGLTSRGPHNEIGEAGGLHDWMWIEYIAREPDRALTFFADVFGFRHEVSEQRENFTYYLLSTDRPRAGLFRSLFERQTSAWLPYIRVEDPAAMAARASQLGGSVLVPPQSRVRNNSLAIVLDPSGAIVALQKYPFEKGTTR